MDDRSRKLLEEESQRLVRALRDVGLDVGSVYDLVNTRDPYPEAMPVLLDHLPRVRHPRMTEGIARALGVREAGPPAAETLLRTFEGYQTPTKGEEHAKWAIANALSTVADDSVFAQVAVVLQEPAHGGARSGMVAALANMRRHREEAVELLLRLVHDEALATQAMITLGEMREPRARGVIEPFLDHDDPWVRGQAKRALAKIDKARGRPS